MANALPPATPANSTSSAKPLLEARSGLERAEKLRQSRQFSKSKKICEAILKRFPNYAAARHTLGLLLADKHEYDAALSHLVHAVMLNPKNWNTLMVLAGVYLRLGSREMAIETLQKARSYQPDDAGILTTLGEIYRDSNEFELGAEAFEKAFKLDNSMTAAKYGAGLCFTHLGEVQNAIDAFETLVEHPPLSISLVYSLSQLPSNMVRSNVLDLLNRAELEPGENQTGFDRSLEFAKAAALDQAGDYAAAWACLEQPNHQIWEKNRDEFAEEIRIQDFFLSEIKRQKPLTKADLRHDQDAPVSLFILGPSRSGKTTMERLISHCKGVKRGYENPIVENAVRQTFQSANFPPRFRIVELPTALQPLCRDVYLEALLERADGAKTFTNTLPGQISAAIHLARTLENVKFVFVKRDLDDIVQRIYMREYKVANSYAYAIEDIRAHVTWYHKMMELLEERLPDSAIIVRYEDMIENPKLALQKAADLCGLTMPTGIIPPLGDDRGCAEPYKAFLNSV